jgi:hypothetical protein
MRRTGAGTYALDTPSPNWPPDYLADQLTTCSPRIAADLDCGEKRNKAQRPQQSEDE